LQEKSEIEPSGKKKQSQKGKFKEQAANTFSGLKG